MNTNLVKLILALGLSHILNCQLEGFQTLTVVLLLPTLIQFAAAFFASPLLSTRAVKMAVYKQKKVFEKDVKSLIAAGTVEPRFNEHLFNENLDLRNGILRPSNSKIYEKEHRYNEPSV